MESKGTDIGLDAKFLGVIGIKISDKITGKATISHTTSKTKNEWDEVTITRPIDVKAPPKKRVIIELAETYRSARLPIQIEAVYEADIYHMERVTYSGGLWHSRWEGFLSAKTNRQSRTLLTRAIVDLQGSNRQIDVVIKEEDIDPAFHPRCQTNYVYTKPKWPNKRSGTCEAQVDLGNFGYNGSDAYAACGVDISSGCKKHSGELEFNGLIRNVITGEYRVETGTYTLRSGYDYWLNREDTEFTLDWDGDSFLNDDEILIDIVDIQNTRCDCYD